MRQRGRDGGFLLIDHRDSPGFDEAERAWSGTSDLSVGKGQVCEAPTKKCWHCEKQLIMNPARMRRREICPKCDEYICDNCMLSFRLTDICDNWVRRMDNFNRWAALQQAKAKGA